MTRFCDLFYFSVATELAKLQGIVNEKEGTFVNEMQTSLHLGMEAKNCHMNILTKVQA